MEREDDGRERERERREGAPLLLTEKKRKREREVIDRDSERGDALALGVWVKERMRGAPRSAAADPSLFLAAAAAASSTQE